MKLRYIGVLFFSTIGIALLAKIIRSNPPREVLANVQNNGLAIILGFVAISILMLVLQTLRWQIILKTTRINLSFQKAFGYKIVGYGISFLTPMAKVGGEPVRASLVERHSKDYTKAFSTIILDKIVDITTMGIMFFIAALVSVLFFSLPQSMLTFLIVLVSVITLALFYFYYQLYNKERIGEKIFKTLRLDRIKFLKKAEKNIRTFDRILHRFYNEHREAFWKSFILSGLAWVIMFVEYFVIMLLFGYTMSIPQLFLIITMMGVAYLLPIPLALGVLEAGQLYIFRLLALNSAAGVGLAMIIRFRDLLWAILGIILLVYYRLRFGKIYSEALEDQYKKIKKV